MDGLKFGIGFARVIIIHVSLTSKKEVVMKGFMKSIALLIIFSQATFAQDVITVEAKRIDVSDNLDLEAVASVFGESENLEDFENRLNDPERQICNLDLNGDGYVDYLRVVENSEEQTILITIQAVLVRIYFRMLQL